MILPGLGAGKLPAPGGRDAGQSLLPREGPQGPAHFKYYHALSYYHHALSSLLPCPLFYNALSSSSLVPCPLFSSQLLFSTTTMPSLPPLSLNPSPHPKLLSLAPSPQARTFEDFLAAQDVVVCIPGILLNALKELPTEGRVQGVGCRV